MVRWNNVAQSACNESLYIYVDRTSSMKLQKNTCKSSPWLSFSLILYYLLSSCPSPPSCLLFVLSLSFIFHLLSCLSALFVLGGVRFLEQFLSTQRCVINCSSSQTTRLVFEKHLFEHDAPIAKQLFYHNLKSLARVESFQDLTSL